MKEAFSLQLRLSHFNLAYYLIIKAVMPSGSVKSKIFSAEYPPVCMTNAPCFCVKGGMILDFLKFKILPIYSLK